MSKERVTRTFDFLGNPLIQVTASNDGGLWNKTIVKTSGAPTVAVASGKAKLLLTNNDEAQTAVLHWGDNLGLDIDQINSVDIYAKIGITLAATEDVIFGVAAAHNATANSVAAHAWFRALAADAIVCQTDDGTNDESESAGISMSTTIRRYRIDFKTGIKSNVGIASVGGKASVLFSGENASNLLRPVARSQQYDMSNYSSGFQLYARVDKTGGTGVPYLEIERFVVDYNRG